MNFALINLKCTECPNTYLGTKRSHRCPDCSKERNRVKTHENWLKRKGIVSAAPSVKTTVRDDIRKIEEYNELNHVSISYGQARRIGVI